jgi:hypothetical protein
MPLLIVPLWLALSRVRWPAALRWALAGSTVLAYAAGWAAVLMFDGAYHPLSLVSVLRATATITLATAVLAPLYFAFAWAMEPVRRTSPAIAATPSPARLDTPATATRPA